MDEGEEGKQNAQQHESWRVLFVSFTRQQQQHKHPQRGRATVQRLQRLPCVLHAHIHSAWAAALVLPPVWLMAPCPP
jgi:hypothetical protein